MHTSLFYYVISHTQFFDILPCVILTGRGFPDIATRAFTHFLAVPPFILFDIDAIAAPNLRHLRLESVRRCVTDDLHSRIIEFGIGSRRYSKTHEPKSYRYCVSMKWVGLHAADIERLQIPNVSKQPFSKLDEAKVKSLLE